MARPGVKGLSELILNLHQRNIQHIDGLSLVQHSPSKFEANAFRNQP